MEDSSGPILVEIDGEKIISYKSPVEKNKPVDFKLWGGVGVMVFVLWFVYKKLS